MNIKRINDILYVNGVKCVNDKDIIESLMNYFVMFFNLDKIKCDTLTCHVLPIYTDSKTRTFMLYDSIYIESVTTDDLKCFYFNDVNNSIEIYNLIDRIRLGYIENMKITIDN